MIRNHPLIRLLRAPRATAEGLSLPEWSIAIRAARQGNLLGRLGYLITLHGITDTLPIQVKHHIESAIRVATSQHRNVRWEIVEIQRSLRTKSIPFVILKGAAYITMDYDAAHGRTLSDIDIMVPHSRIVEAEGALIDSGWFPGKLNPYDQKYYRTWMHELPPLRHLERGTTLDVHHTIIPPTTAIKPDVTHLWNKAIPWNGSDEISVLSPEDMVLHSAAHLFHDGEMEHGLRDLVDMDSLITEFSTNESFWNNLTERANLLDLLRPLYYALQCRSYFLGAEPPAAVTKAIAAHGKLEGFDTQVVLHILMQSIGANLNKKQTPSLQLAKLLVFIRSHYLRMPMHLLIPHLLRKMALPKSE